jgi:hypothetical protein
MLKQKTVYFREEDLPLWEAIENKAQWLHDGLTTGIVTIPPRNTYIYAPDKARPPDPETGYPCCQKAKPCKHWKFDNLNSQWVNELTGKVKEIV